MANETKYVTITNHQKTRFIETNMQAIACNEYGLPDEANEALRTGNQVMEEILKGSV